MGVGGEEDVNSGGTAIRTDVSAGGIEIVNSGGVTSGLRSGTVVFSGGGQTVNGGLAIHTLVNSGGVQSTSCFVIEVLATFFFLYVIIGTTSKGAAVGFAGIPIGLCLTLIHLFLIPVTNASVNPARSTGPALFAGGAYVAQLWLFWLAPILGAAIAGLISRWQHEAPDM